VKRFDFFTKTIDQTQRCYLPTVKIVNTLENVVFFINIKYLPIRHICTHCIHYNWISNFYLYLYLLVLIFTHTKKVQWLIFTRTMSHGKNLRNWETTEVDRWVYNKEETLKKSLAWYQKDFEVKKKPKKQALWKRN